MLKKKIVCIIPVKAKSSRLKKKNFLKLNSTPLYLHAIKKALKSKCFDKIIVSSDNKNLKKICDNYRIEFHHRKKYVDGNSEISLATYNVIDELELGDSYDVVAQMMATCPLRTTNNIKSSLINFFKKKNSFQISVYDCSWIKNDFFFFEIEKKTKLLKNKNLKNKKCLYPSGVIWIAKISEFLRQKTFYGKNFSLFELPWYNSIDIDYKNDFDNVKYLSKFIK